MTRIAILLTSVLAFVIVACDDLFLGDQDNLVGLEENLLPPPALNDGWDVSDLASENIDATRVQQLIKNLQADHKNIHSLLVIRNNKLVAESYFAGWHRERLHTLRSASKSFVSTLTGIAVDKGYITVDQKVFDFFPEYAHLRNNEKNEIEIKHLLTMSSGLKWDEKTYLSGPRNDEYALDMSNDRLGYILGKEMEALPGTKFVYNSGCPFLQAAILKRVTGEEIEVYSDKYLFKPMGITNYYWRRERDGIIPAAGPLFLRPRDMAKLGQLFLDGGKWKGTQIISSDWVNEATATFIGNELTESGYGYNWWTSRESINDDVEIRIYMARGNGGQFIFVIPDLNAVVAFTGGNFNAGYGAPSPYAMLTNIILPAML